ncbi:hypothetical protein EGI22_19135 [Lacihabitans sp. LS3-19]|uniref:hypothetical protein n=1 Tax=Lacihabitans sp. LS3-19 TaxID=2487335 RepID=UPI0020CCB257|nr:hypothetical protein [Lacihabitans sp. LS3-19]MCP9770022.1 hypothetical protein [Lacihabitans sp. LS3-19]
MKSLGLLFLGVLLVFSCKKDPVVTVEKSTLEYLTGTSSKKWIVTEGIVSFEGTQLNLVANQPPCITDNVLVLNTNKTYELNEGASKCDPSKDPDVIIKANWSLVEEPKTITIDKFIFLGYVLENSKFLITSIDDNKFVGETEVTLQGKTYKANITFSKVN